MIASPQEIALEPARPIIDAHHHLWDHPADPASGMPARRYLIHEYQRDLESGHNIVASVHVEAASMYNPDAPSHLAPVGETEFACGIAAMSASGGYGPTKMCAGIIGFVDLTGGDTVQPAIEAHMRAAGGRFRGIRDGGTWDADESIRRGKWRPARYRYRDPAFRQGFAHLARNGLTFDAWLYHPQLDDVLDLARAFPDTTIVVDHCGGPMRVGRHADDPAATYRDWLDAIRRIAAAPNLMVKLGGLGMFTGGFTLDQRPEPIGSEELAELLRPFIAPVIEHFGPGRCMFESNFPPDRNSYSYSAIWNAFKRMASDLGEADKHALFFANADRVYRLGMAERLSASSNI